MQNLYTISLQKFTDKKESGGTAMNKVEALKAELKKMGIFTDVDLRAVIRKTSLDISLMAAGQHVERMVG